MEKYLILITCLIYVLIVIYKYLNIIKGLFLWGIFGTEGWLFARASKTWTCFYENCKLYRWSYRWCFIYNHISNKKQRKIKRFYPTRLAIQLANGINDNVDIKQEEKGYIVVETNYRIYAYTGLISDILREWNNDIFTKFW